MGTKSTTIRGQLNNRRKLKQTKQMPMENKGNSLNRFQQNPENQKESRQLKLVKYVEKYTPVTRLSTFT
jgi:hypothetical protein